MDFFSAMEFISSFSHGGSPVNDLSRIKGLMEKLENPQDKLKFVHIAGTNGKGSVLEYASNALIKAGFKTGQFTSPFIECYCDRIRINGNNISEMDVAEICERVQQAVSSHDYSQFEITFAIAMLYFLQENCDVVFLETGIGGTLDATNIISTPLVSVITSVSLDHMAILGNTVEEIAKHKLGIIKERCPTVISHDNKDTVLFAAKAQAAQMHSKLTIPDKEVLFVIKSDKNGVTFDYKGIEYELTMCGKHQAANAVTAIECINVLKSRFAISDDDIYNGLKESRIASRTEIFSRAPLIIIDGGHNSSGIDRFAEFLQEQGISDAVGIFGMVKGKAMGQGIERMSRFYRKVYCVDGYIDSSIPSNVLAERFTAAGVEAVHGKYTDLVQQALNDVQSECLPLIISGSLYMTSAVKKILAATVEG